jgi:hypothetical protein
VLWIAKVMPSAFALLNWKVKSLVKFWIFTGVLYQAVPASLTTPSVSCRRVSSRSVLPLKVMELAEALKPLGKLIPVPEPIE